MRLRLSRVDLARALVLAAALVAWQVAADAGLVDRYFVASPLAVWQALVELVRSGDLARHLPITLAEAGIGLVVGSTGALVLAIVAGRWRPFGDVLEPFAVLGNAIPRIVLAPLFLFWLGVGPASKAALSALMVFFIVYLSVYAGMRAAETRYVEHARLLGARSADLIRDVYVPSVLGWLFASLRLALGFAFAGAIVGELLGSSRGLGFLVNAAAGNFQPAGVLAVVVVILVLIGIGFALVRVLERRALAWRAPEIAAFG